MGGRPARAPDFDRGYLDHHWADGLHLLQARSTRGDRNLVQYERQRRRSAGSSLEKPIFCCEFPQFDLPADLTDLGGIGFGRAIFEAG